MLRCCTFRKQVLVGAPLKHGTVIYDQDLIYVLHSGQAVSYDHHSPALCSTVQGILHCSFAFCV